MDEHGDNLKVGVVIVTIVFIVLAILGIKCAYRIGPGFAGVIYNADGGIEDETLGQGWHVIMPWKSVIEYPISTETVYYSADSEPNTSVDANTKDGKKLNMNITYSYHMNKDTLPELFTNFRGQPYQSLEEGIMRNHMMQAIAEVTSQFNLLDVTGDKLPEVNSKIFEKFKTILDKDGIILESFTLVPNPDEVTKQAIQKVLDAQNALAQAKVEKEKALVEAEQAKITAKGKADAAIIAAEGTAKANELVRQSLTDEIIKQKAIDKWDGKLPTYQGSGGFMFNIPIKE